MRRRTFLYFAAAYVALALASGAAAQAYPLRPVRILVGFPGGSASDTTARLIGQFLSERLGQQFVVENRTGAASNLAAEALAHAPPDGYTLLLVITDLIGGRVQVVFDTFAASIEFVRAGKLRRLAVTTATRSPILPDVPPLAEFLPPYDASTWLGVGAPKNTPREIVEKLNAEINTALADPTMQERIANFGYAVLPGSPAEFGKFIVEETKKWGEVVRAANMKPD